MKEFQFEISQRIILPAEVLGSNIQAVITGRSDFIDREPKYDVQYLLTGALNGLLHIGFGVFTESSLVAAQPPVTARKSKSRKRR